MLNVIQWSSLFAKTFNAIIFVGSEDDEIVSLASTKYRFVNNVSSEGGEQACVVLNSSKVLIKSQACNKNKILYWPETTEKKELH